MSLGNASLVIANIQANQIAAFIRVTISQNISFSIVQLIYMSYPMNWNYDMMEFTQAKTFWNLTHAWDHWKEKWVKNDALDCNKNTWKSSDFKSFLPGWFPRIDKRLVLTAQEPLAEIFESTEVVESNGGKQIIGRLFLY